MSRRRLALLVRALEHGVTAARPEQSGQSGQSGQPGHPAQPRALPTAAYPGWEAIYADNVERIYRLMYAKVGNRHDAEDLTSQVFLTAFGPLRATASVGEVRAYLLTTARTVLATHWRSTLGHQVTVIDVDEAGLEDFTGPAEDERAGRTAERIGAILSGLPERHRAILTLRFLRGYSIKAAAAELGVTVANAKVLQHRALRRAAGLDQEGEAS
ncbi:RNA polymerase sigma-70 factor (ECF subfamily) [Catenulispora sp. EB89]|uniref:RNA polymerase sigma factor n=1 Tax=Catenulispora sp. EB89 TaxID=3156257 RepID=UPI0035138E0F